MARTTGTYRDVGTDDEPVRCVMPHRLPPCDPAVFLSTKHRALMRRVDDAMTRLRVAASIVPSAQWLCYGFVRTEALSSSRSAGSQATLQDVVTVEATCHADRVADVEEICHYIAALDYARRQMRDPQGLPISRRLLAGVHGADRRPDSVRTSQSRPGGSRPGTAHGVPPPPDTLDDLLADLDRWIHAKDAVPPLVRAGLAHVPFDTLHPFHDGNGRLGRMLITLLLEHWGLIEASLLYPSLSFQRRQQEYDQRLDAVRLEGDWEGWVTFYLDCIAAAAEDGIAAAITVCRIVERDRERVLAHAQASVSAIRLCAVLPEHPILTVAMAVAVLGVTKPTAQKAIAALVSAGVLVETTGKQRDRRYAYEQYLHALSRDA